MAFISLLRGPHENHGRDKEANWLDASHTHMFAPGTHRRIQRAPKAGATLEEIMLKLCVVQAVQPCNLAVSILADELEKRAKV